MTTKIAKWKRRCMVFIRCMVIWAIVLLIAIGPNIAYIVCYGSLVIGGIPYYALQAMEKYKYPGKWYYVVLADEEVLEKIMQLMLFGSSGWIMLNSSWGGKVNCIIWVLVFLGIIRKAAQKISRFFRELK